MRLVAAAGLLALSNGVAAPEQMFLSRHNELRLAKAGGASCAARVAADAAKALSTIRRDLNGDGREEIALVVVSRREPRQHGVVVLGLSDGQLEEHWVVRPGAVPLAGLAVFRGLESTWLIVVACGREDGGAFRWNGTAYASDDVW